MDKHAHVLIQCLPHIQKRKFLREIENFKPIYIFVSILCKPMLKNNKTKKLNHLYKLSSYFLIIYCNKTIIMQ